MSRAVLFCNGEIGDLGYHQALLKEDDFIIAVDGGGCFCHAMDLKPQIAIGDFDSLPPALAAYFEAQETKLIPFPADKNYIDLVLAIEEARKRGFDDILILGALGGKRADMHMGNILCLSAYDKKGEKIVIKNEFSEISFLREGFPFAFQGEIGNYVSLIPLSDVVETGLSRNLKYQLKGLVFQRGETRSISNELTATEGELLLVRGNAIIIIQKG
ncbi:MAG TPA: thiamine diphosphokinase [Clostridiales bacterium]|nr:thiamine diphosphokinase [Clostridiales bacterium]